MIINDIKKVTNEALLVSSCHGLPNMIRTKSKCLLIMWLICFLICSAFFSYLAILSIAKFFKYEVLTNIEVIYESPAHFPIITICNLNGVKHSYLLNETIISCRFDNSNYNWTDFEIVYLPSYGNCFRFNGGKDYFNKSGETKKTHMPGKFDGLVLELFSGIPDRDETWSPGYGFHIFVHNTTDNLDRIIKGVDISPGFQTSITVNRIFYYKLSIPYENCFIDLDSFGSFDSLLVKQILQEKQTYQQSTCFEYCRKKQLIDKCNCKNFSNNLYNCNEDADKSCVNKLNTYFYNTGYLDCLQTCPLECNTQEFKLAISFLDYPHLSKLDSFVNNPIIKSKYPNNTEITVERLKKSLVSVCIYYDENKYTVISKEPKMTFSDLISNIGGVMGIFIGTSFLSFVELIELFVVILNLIFKNKI